MEVVAVTAVGGGGGGSVARTGFYLGMGPNGPNANIHEY